MKPFTLLPALAAAGLLAMAAASQAKPLQAANNALGACSVIADVQVDAADCVGYTSGNDSVTAVNDLAAAAGWAGLGTLTQFKDNNSAAGSDTTLFDAVVTSSGGDASQGVLNFAQGLIGSFVLTLKGGNDYAAYLYTGGIAAGGQISFDIPGVQGAGFSHASVYVDASRLNTPLVPAANAVPEPQTWALLAPALLGLGLARRRKA